ncbi:histidine kinase [Sphingomonas sp. Leaf23]|uniref:sensor histidine kinase n=1 Tax=Sphingomonas sp. Leaf23 TaxID=1735689 RepID=UPI000700BE6C|nr:histidine kinase dimerization/phosphoacceptor domain -containing protein [Sphingomonas sp. Leaf23]KQM86071.1 histidine kinase [Sphingomonas sp. Leaf23]
MPVVEENGAGSDGPADAIRYRLDQQRILAEFGGVALRSRDIDEIVRAAVELVARGMRTRLAKFLHHDATRGGLIVRAGIGWDEGVVGLAEMGDDLASPAGFAFRTGEAVISNHLGDEKRFRTPGFMADHGVKRAINVLVEANGRRFGVLEVDSRSDGRFEEDDLAFMQGFANLIGVAIERLEAEAGLRAAIEHQELLTREASHRVKNSLAMVSAMLNLQMREDDDPRVQRLLGDAQARIVAIGQAHDQLWQGDRVGVVALDRLLCGIVEQLKEQAPDHAIDCEIEPLVVSGDTAIPLGLLLTELVTNAIKYAYGEGGGAVRIETRCADGQLSLEVVDRGQGLPAGFDPAAARPTSLGMRMVSSLARQLGGTLSFEDAGPGTHVSFVMPLPEAV